MRQLILTLALTLTFFWACQSDKTTESQDDTTGTVELMFEDQQEETGDYSAIGNLKTHFGEEMVFDDDAKAESFLKAVEEFAAENPNDARTPQTLYEAGFVARNLGRMEDAMALYEKVWKDYPTSKVAPEALFLHGFIYDEEFSDKHKAADLYRRFLEKYPNNKYKPDVEKLLDMIELTPEQLLEKLQKQNQ